MVNKFIFVIGLMACAASVYAQSLYRCGNTFQQTPCDGEGSGAITVKEAFSSTGGNVHHAGSKSMQGLDEATFNTFYLKGIPVVGMSAQQLIRVLGVPVQVNSKTSKGVAHQQHVYEKDDRRVYVQLKDDVATNIAYREARKTNRKAARKQSSGVCPTELEIRNAKVAANSLTLSPKERVKRLKAVEKMERCGQINKR